MARIRLEGREALPIGTEREYGNHTYVKTASGWKYLSKKNRGPKDYASVSTYRAEFESSLSDDQKASFIYYSNSGYAYMNKALRQGGPRQEHITKAIDSITEALNGASFPEDRTAYRFGSHRMREVVENAREGDLIEDYGFMSTTTSPHDWEISPTGVILSVKIPQGAKAAAIPTSFPEEEEILLQRGTKMRILSKAEQDGALFLEVEVVID